MAKPLVHIQILVAAVLLLFAGTTHAGQSISYYHVDAFGTPVAKTDHAGNVIWRASHEPYGKAIGGEPEDGPGYTGHVADAATGLIYAEQRYYDPALGLFLSADPVEALEDPLAAFNRYRYANGNPYRFGDPDGRRSLEFRDPLALGCASDPTCRFSLGEGNSSQGHVAQMMRRHRTPSRQTELMERTGVDGELFQNVRASHEAFVTTLLTSLGASSAKGAYAAPGQMAAATARARVAAAVITTSGEVRYSATAAKSVANRAYIGPTSIRETILGGVRAADPQGKAGRFMYTIGAKNGSRSGRFEVLVNEADGIVEHAVFMRGVK